MNNYQKFTIKLNEEASDEQSFKLISLAVKNYKKEINRIKNPPKITLRYLKGIDNEMDVMLDKIT